VPEGDTLYRTATVLREALAGREVTGARGRPDGPALGRVLGSTVQRVDARGKHLLIDFSAGLTLHTHLRMHGSWHRYQPGERWKRAVSRAVAVIEVPTAVAVCFDAPTVELLDTRAVAIHPVLAALGPDLLDPDVDLDAVVARLREPSRAAMPLGDALLDQTALAGLGNVYRSEVCFIERLDPFIPLRDVTEGHLRRVVETGHRLLVANRLSVARTSTPDALGGAPGAGGPHHGPRLYVYGRAGRPCLRCGTAIRTRKSGELARDVYWCPRCQASGDAIPPEAATGT
jgi:endonuclease VIII